LAEREEELNEQWGRKYQKLAEKLAQEQKAHTQFKKEAEQRSNRDDLVKILIAGVWFWTSKNEVQKYQSQERETEDRYRNLAVESAKARVKNKKLETLTQSKNGVCRSLEQHLGVDNLKKIKTTHPMPEGKSLADLITFYWENKDKGPGPEPENRKSEKAIVSQIIQECDLGLNENTSLTQVIDRIKQLIAKPPVDTPFGESLEKIMKIDLDYLTKNLGLNSPTEKLKEAVNYAQLAQLRNDLIESYYKTKNLSTNLPIQPANKMVGERVLWLGFLGVSWLAIIILLLRLNKNKKK
jgi:hypothetical protein